MREVEKLINELHTKESSLLLDEFDKWFGVMKLKFNNVILPEIVIAEKCIEITNKRKRIDKAKLIFIDKIK